MHDGNYEKLDYVTAPLYWLLK